MSAQVATFDGNYANPAGTTGTGCATTTIRSVLRVENGQASLRTISAGVLQGAVQPDGSLMIQFGQNHLSGKFAGSHFSGELVYAGRSQSCRFNLQFDRS